jgi:hypothetical protein
MEPDSGNGLMEGLRIISSWNLLLGGADLRQPIRLVVVRSGDVMELTALEEPTELLDIETIGGHVGILSVPFPRDLVHHKVGISKAEDPPDANLLGQLEPVHQVLVFSDVV